MKYKNNFSAVSNALNWVRNHCYPTGGILVQSNDNVAYPEVTGYFIPTLLEYGEKEIAKNFLEWLLCLQRSNGAFTSPWGEDYIFDSAQVLRGLLAGKDIMPEAVNAAKRCGDYLLSQMVNDGKDGYKQQYDGDIPETVHLYSLPPLLELAGILNDDKYKNYALNCLNYYINHNDLLKMTTLTHFLSYEIEALIDMGRSDLAFPILEQLSKEQRSDGAVRAYKSVDWVCSPGLAQIAICWYKLGLYSFADKALEWLEEHQQDSGGFLGSYGDQAGYFPNVEPSWAVKFYLDANKLRIQSFFKVHKDIFPTEIDSTDGRLQLILGFMDKANKVADIGCGKGRFLKAIKEIYPEVECTGVDISNDLLGDVPDNINKLIGMLEDIPLDDDYFDVVFSVEAIEHSANWKKAIDELIRVTKPGGQIIIIDKQANQWGRLECPSWETWPETDEIKIYLNSGCDQVDCKPVSYNGVSASDGLMVAWIGTKRSRLSGEEWNNNLIDKNLQKQIVEKIKTNKPSEWAKEIILNTTFGSKVLEIGSGTGEISLFLAQAGRNVTISDISNDSLDFALKCAKDLNLKLNSILLNASEIMPFRDNEFNCVWQSGLLEHFTVDERRKMLKEWSRISLDKVISIVPNASCLAYRVGKLDQEQRGVWPYGYENPLYTLREDYEAVGLKVLKEYSVGVQHALNFMDANDALKLPLLERLNNRMPKDNCNQGYLLITIGTKI
ncbi:MAG: methyltransferase domain-containing protein [Candidatus Gastranaerophilaceae bacterium]|jgi:malonyl-CoA O-methyltransferase